MEARMQSERSTRRSTLLSLLVLFAAPQAWAAALPGGSLDPNTIPKYVEPLTIPPLMPSVAANTFSIAARQRTQQVLPTGFPATTVWSYGSTNRATSFNWPAFTIEAQQGTQLQV